MPKTHLAYQLCVNFVIYCVLIILFLQTAEDICRYTTDHGFLNVRQNMQNFSQLGNQLAKDVDFPIHRIYLIYVHSRFLSSKSIFSDSGPINAKFCVFHSEQYLSISWKLWYILHQCRDPGLWIVDNDYVTYGEVVWDKRRLHEVAKICITQSFMFWNPNTIPWQNMTTT